MTRNRYLTHGLPAVAAVLFGFSLWSVLGGTGTSAMIHPPAEPPVNPYPTAVAGTGLVEPSSEVVAVAVELGGVVSRMLVSPGQLVAAGEPLFAIDDRRYAAVMEEAAAALRAAEAELGTIDRRIALQQASVERSIADVTAAEAERERALLDRARYARLAAHDWASRQREEEATADARKAEATVASVRAAKAVAYQELEVQKASRTEAEARVGQARAALKRARVDLDRTIVRAPIAGAVLRINVRPGEYAQTGVPSEPLLTLGAIRPLHVRVEVDEADAWRVRAGAMATSLLRGNSAIRTELHFVRFEPDLVPKRSLTGSRAERVDTRVLQVIYQFDPAAFPARVGQQVDVFIADTAEASAGAQIETGQIFIPSSGGVNEARQ
jgi:HlyD family secretion protein